MTKTRTEMRGQLRRHGENLLAIFPDCRICAPLDLCRALRRLEKQGAALALQFCNGPELSEAALNRRRWAILTNVNAILQPIEHRVPIFVNLDPRGYALKIEGDYVREHDLAIERDWGGDGIIAPDFS